MPGYVHPLAAAASLSTAQRTGGAAGLGVAIAVLGVLVVAAMRFVLPRNLWGTIGWWRLATLILIALTVPGVLLAGFAWLGVGPLALTVPAGLLVGYVALSAFGFHLSTGLVPAMTVMTAVLAAGLALVATAATLGWLWLAGLALLATGLVAALRVLTGHSANS